MSQAQSRSQGTGLAPYAGRMPAHMTEPKFPWALLVMLGMFAFIAFSSKPPWLQVAGGIAVLIVGAGAFYQMIPRRDDSRDWKTDEHDDELDGEPPTS